jgi:general secretion pathway protein B
MSYILDALKKSDKERQRGTVPDVMTAPDVMGEAPKKRSLWPYLIAVALILNAGMLVWWLARHPGGPSGATRPVATRDTVAKAAPDQERPAADAGSVVAPSPSKPAKTSEPVLKSSEERKPVPRPDIPSAATDVRRGGTGRQPLQEEAKTAVPRSNESTPAPGASEKGLPTTAAVPPQQAPEVKRPDAEPEPAALPAPVPSKTYSLQELPPAVRQVLPDLAISTHLFAADTSSRMVRINGKLLREGEFLSAGVKLEEITADGVIFSYQGYRLRVGLK